MQPELASEHTQSSAYESESEDGFDAQSELLIIDPMTAETYKAILAYRSQQRLSENEGDDDDDDDEERDIGCKTSCNDLEDEELKLRQDMARGKLRWYGVWFLDLWCFLKNNNPVCAICHSHPLHPISRRERLLVYVAMVVFKCLVSCFVAGARACIDCGMATCSTQSQELEGCNVLKGTGNVTMMISERHGFGHGLNPAAHILLDPRGSFCCRTVQLGAAFFIKNFKVRNFDAGGKIYTFLWGVVFAFGMFQLVACSCAQKYKSRRKRHLLEYIGHLVAITLTLTSAIAGFMMFFKYWLREQVLLPLLETLLGSQVIVWACAFFLTPGIGCFALLHCCELRRKNHPRERKFHVTAEDYQEYCRAHSGKTQKDLSHGAYMNGGDTYCGCLRIFARTRGSKGFPENSLSVLLLGSHSRATQF